MLRLARGNRATALAVTVPLVIGLLVVAQLTAGIGPIRIQATSLSPLAQQATSPSWNPATNCNAVVLTMEQYLGGVPNPTQTQPNAGADYSGGALPLEGSKPPGTSPPSSSWPFQKRSTSPPCTVTLANGTVLPTLVEIHRVKVGFVSNDECGSVFANICDKTFNSCNAVLAPN